MAAILSAVYGGGAQLFTNTNAPLAGGKIYTYLAGSTTPAATWTDSTQLVQNANPLVLDSYGRLSTEIWLANAVSYKFIVTDSSGNQIGTVIDNIPGVNSNNATQSEWVAGSTPTYISTTSFSVPGNQATTYTGSRRVQFSVNSGTYYGTIVSGTYNGSTLTTVVITPDSTALDASLSGVNYGFLNATPSSLPPITGITAASVQNQQYVYGTTTGTAAAFVLAPSVAISSYVAGQEFDVVFNATNTAGATINISGQGAIALVRPNGAGGYTAVTGGSVASGWRSRVGIIAGPLAVIRDGINGYFGSLSTGAYLGASTALTYFMDSASANGLLARGSSASPANRADVYAGGSLVGYFTSTGLNATAIGATTPSTGAFTTLSASGAATLGASGGTDGTVLFKRASDGIQVGSLIVDSANSRLKLSSGYDLLSIWGSGTKFADFSSTGLAVTGALSATGSITANSGAGFVVITNTQGTAGSPVSIPMVVDNYKSAGMYSVNNLGDSNGTWFKWKVNSIANVLSDAMTLDASGNFFVGTTGVNPAGNAFVYAPSNAFAQLGHITGTASAVPYVQFMYNAGVIGSITQSGTTAVLYNTTSDARLKENIVNAESATPLIDQIQVRQYDWKSDGSHQRYGFIAQELVEVYPEAVHQPEDPEAMMAVDYSKLVPLLLKEVQELRQRLTAAGIA